MILDERSEFGDAVALNTGAPGTYLIGDVMDLVIGDIGPGLGDLYIVLSIDTAVTSAGAATVQFKLSSDGQAAIATDGTATVHAATGAIGKATLVAGFTAFATNLRDLQPTPERFLGLLQVTGTAALTAGKVNIFLTPSPARWQAYDSPSQDSI